jgi:transcriptional regulator with GAF, ATPase, and Fis domain
MNLEIDVLAKKIQAFGKENLSDILHYTAVGLKSLFECHTVRINLEDLHQGILICQYMTEQKHPDERQITKFISHRNSITSQAFYENKVVQSWDLPENYKKYRDPFEKLSGIQASVVFPIVHELRPVGTLTLDWQENGKVISSEKTNEVKIFLANISSTVDRAKRFHQQISFSRHLDLARKKEAAWMIVRSAVKLIDKLSLASVMIPNYTKNPKSNLSKTTDLVEIIAVYSKNKDDATIYQNKDVMSVLNDKNLINRIVKYNKKHGLVARIKNKDSLYIENIKEENFVRKEIVQKLNMVSLYQISKFENQSGKFICSVNYYTNETHNFSPIEIRLLEEHASMLEKSISGDSSEHIEIEVLGEIEELLSNEDESLPVFLHKILDKTSELIGANSGTISILKFIDGKPWLLVENSDGSLLGAKSRGWIKSKIPELPVGSDDVIDELKSLSGYSAHTAKPIIISNVQNETFTNGFYKNLSPLISSEMAVPIISGSNVIGVINQDHFQKGYFSLEHKRIVQVIASLISPKVNNLIKIQELKQEITLLRDEVEYRDPKVSSYYLGNVIGRSKTIHNLVDRIDTVVESVCNRMLKWDNAKKTETNMGLPTLLVHGETGTGKEFFFNNIYSRITEIFKNKYGENYKLILKKTNIAAYSGELTYSELFGHKKGAYTSAEFNRQGILEEANGGVVFLDEIGDADPKTQVQLLRFLDTGVFMRLGENQPRYSRIFLIAATNKNLRKEIDAGHFREDLYHRLNALSFRIPSLNERQEDISDLATHFLGILFQTYKKGHIEESLPHLEKSAIEYLINHNYRGNVRELKNILMRAMIFRKTSVIRLNDIIEACQIENPSLTPTLKKPQNEYVNLILDQLESGEGDFWSKVHQPFKKNKITKDTVKNLMQTAKNRYQSNLPGLAIKLGACSISYQSKPDELKKFISFKNFLYKTIKISETN